MMRHSVLSRLLAFQLAVSIAAPSVVWAQDATKDAATEAADYYNQATIAYQQGDYEKAAELLDLAFGKNPDLVYKYNRILALQAHGNFEKALSELNTMYGPMKADAQNRFDDIDQIKEQLEGSIAAAEPETDPEPDPEPEPDPIAPPPDNGPNYLAWGLIGGGAAVLATGVAFATGVFVPRDVKKCVGLNTSSADCVPYMTNSLSDDDGVFRIEEEDGTVRTGNARDARDIADDVVQTHQIAAVTMMAGGAVLGAVGAILIVLDQGSSSSEAPPQSVQLMPYVSHDGAGAALTLRF